ncbi:MAG: hypothetical protein ACTSO9_20140 [Candidatus Helarchaeota archaeon]
MACEICGAKTTVVECERCKKKFCVSCSGAAAGVEDSPYCKKCTLRVYRVRCKKCGNRFKSQDDLEKHFLKHPVHRTQFD